MQTKHFLSHKLQKAKADANFFVVTQEKKKKNLENLISRETSGFSDPAVPWLRLRKAEIKAAFRTPSLSLSPGEEALSGEDLSFSSVGERNPWSRSLKRCVFTKPEGKVVEVTHREAAGWLRIIQVFSLTNQKYGGKGGKGNTATLILKMFSVYDYISLCLYYVLENKFI